MVGKLFRLGSLLTLVSLFVAVVVFTIVPAAILSAQDGDRGQCPIDPPLPSTTDAPLKLQASRAPKEEPFEAADALAEEKGGKGKLAPTAAIACGTVLKKDGKAVRILGDINGKGTRGQLIEGGWMKFDLNRYPVGARLAPSSETINEDCSAFLRVRVRPEERKGEDWIWLCGIGSDPMKASPETLFAQVQRHRPIYSFIIGGGLQNPRPPDRASNGCRMWPREGFVWFGEPQGWLRIPMPNATGPLNEALAKKNPQERYLAVAVGFE
jgi:hypothetical protein